MVDPPCMHTPVLDTRCLSNPQPSPFHALPSKQKIPWVLEEARPRCGAILPLALERVQLGLDGRLGRDLLHLRVFQPLAAGVPELEILDGPDLLL